MKEITPTTGAELKIKYANLMTQTNRSELARWLQCQAKKLLRDGQRYAPSFHSKYIYTKGRTYDNNR